MQSIMLPSFPQLKNEEAITTVNNFIRELGKRDKKLMIKQAENLNQFTKGIISAIKSEQHQT